MSLIIALMGPAGAGKSTVADYLVKSYGATRYSLMGPLKAFAKAIFDFTDQQLYGTQAQKEAPDPRYCGKSARWFLQKLGTEGGRATFGQDFWTKMCVDRIARDGHPLAVVDDTRFINEAQLIMGTELFRARRGVEHPTGELIFNAFGANPLSRTLTEDVGLTVKDLYLRTFDAGKKVFGQGFWSRMQEDEDPYVSAVPGVVVKLWPTSKNSSDDGTHSSESEWRLAPFDYEVRPERFGLEELYKNADEIMSLLGKETA